MNKKLLAPLLVVSLLASTTTFPASTKDPAYIATIGAGLIMTGGGIFWLVKNPNNKEGAFKRTIRTVFALGLTAGGIGLILGSKQLHTQIADKGLGSIFHSLDTKINNLVAEAKALFNSATKA